MEEPKFYALVGHCKMANGLPLGVSTYAFDPMTGEMAYCGSYERMLRVGAQAWCPEHGRVYVVDEFWSLEGRTGGGGRVAALKPTEDGALVKTSVQRTFGTNPSYLAVDATGRYLLVTHHCTEHFVTRLVRTEQGYDTEVDYDLCTLLLYRLEENGDIGPIADVYAVPGVDVPGGHRFPHLHCVVPDPERKYFVVCDKGMDKIYTFRIDYQREKLIKCAEVVCKPSSEPRYCCFHPSKSVFYGNYEGISEVTAYALDTESGMFRPVASCDGMPENVEQVSPSDIVIHPNGRFVYLSERMTNSISQLEVMPDGAMVRRQTVSCGGENPRGLCVTPEGRFLLAANMQSGNVTRFAIGTDGGLTLAGQTETGGFPGNIQIICL